MFSFDHSGSFNKTEKFLRDMAKLDISGVLHSAAKQGVAALSDATPMDSGRAATSWSYEITKGRGLYTITWINNDVENGFPVAIMLQYGYGTGTGGYVSGIDYINPAMRPVFDEIAQKVWKAVTSA